jgi:GNAT superfamily N-acetyltransferase
LRLVEIPRAVAIHRAAFPEFFLTFLGPDFLTLLYRFYVTGITEIAFAALYRDQIVGTLLGTTQPQKFYRRLAIKYAWRFALAALKPFLQRPAILPRLIRGLIYRGDHPDFEQGGALLASICVDVPSQHRGVGSALVIAFEREVLRRGAKFAYLATDRDQNEKTLLFYKRLGWMPTGEFATREGRAMVVCCKFFEGS